MVVWGFMPYLQYFSNVTAAYFLYVLHMFNTFVKHVCKKNSFLIKHTFNMC